MTVREVMEALAKLPSHLPVAGAMVYAVSDMEDGDSEQKDCREVSAVDWQGRYVELVCDGPLP